MEMTPVSGLPYLLALGATMLALWGLRQLAFPIGLLDKPGGRKVHDEAVPLVGGLAMFLGFCLSSLFLELPLAQLPSLLAGASLLVLVGVLDDLHELSSSPRFLVQIGAALIMTFSGGVVLQDLGAIGPSGGTADLGLFAVPLTVFATVGVINAVNMSDGIDGLAGSMALVALGSLALVAFWGGQVAWLPVLGLLIAAVLGFLFFNLRRGRALVFMGDAGSMFLGFVLAWFLIAFSQGGDRLMPPAVALWILAVPLIDTVAMMLRRILKGRSPFAADREHFHHVLLLAGFSPKATLAIIAAVALVMASTGLSAWYLGVSEATLFYGFLAVFALYFWSIMRAWKVKRFLTRSLHLHGPHHHPQRTDNG
jgi:UDP-GlcNAc:undecaprenyl-phosphate GlcNAc-1-phosphate transferase